MKVESVGKVRSGQDGALYKGLLFRGNGDGSLAVYRMSDHEMLDNIMLDKVEQVMPHSNAVFFGGFYDEGDEFPVLYTNLYNSYAKAEDRREGTLAAYRITRKDGKFTSTLLQLIRIGFVEDRELWKSLPGSGDYRPYGNFILDTEKNRLWAFVMRDKEPLTRFFGFDMPSIRSGESRALCPVVTLNKEDIRARFDIPYQHAIQGACFHQGIIYTLEGFGTNPDYLSVLRLADTEKGEQIGYYDFPALGMSEETEMIDYDAESGTFLYSDSTGELFRLTF